MMEHTHRALVSPERLDRRQIRPSAAIGENIRHLLEAADPVELRSLMRQHLGVTEEGASEKLRRRRAQREEIRTKINNILDNITRENREFADQRIAELKRELLEMQEGSIDEQRRVIRAFVRQIRLDPNLMRAEPKSLPFQTLRPVLATEEQPQGLLLRW